MASSEAGGYYLVLDQGGQSSRALLFDARLNQVAQASVSIGTRRPRPGFVEHCSEQLVRSLFDCLGQLAASLDDGLLRNIHGAALICQRSSFLALRRDDLTPLTPVISWQDSRNQALVERLSPELARLRGLTGLRFNAHYGASKMRWLLDNDPAVQRAAADHNLLFLPLSAYLVHCLTGGGQGAGHKVPAVDAVSAARTFLTAAAARHWHSELLRLFSISPDYLPHIVASDEGFGRLRLAGSDIPMRLLGGDQSFIPYALGKLPSTATLFINIGSGAFLQRPIDKERRSAVDERLLCTVAVVSDRDNLWVAEGCVNGAVVALNELWQRSGRRLSYEEVARGLASQIKPSLFINCSAGTGSPHWLSPRPGYFLHHVGAEDREFEVGMQTGADDEMLLVQAVTVIESIVFGLMDNIFLLADTGEKQARQKQTREKEDEQSLGGSAGDDFNIVISGGLSGYDGLCQRLADLSRRAVFRPDDCELSARGAAFFLRADDGGDHDECDELAGQTFMPCIETATDDYAGLKARYRDHRRQLARLSAAEG